MLHGPRGGVSAPLRISPCVSKETCPAGQSPGVGGFDFEHSKDRCNFLGPFCHWQVAKTFTPGGECAAPWCSCCAWTGGANENQPQGFPNYYLYKFLYRLKGGVPPKESDPYPQMAYAEAKKICARATGVPAGEPSTLEQRRATVEV